MSTRNRCLPAILLFLAALSLTAFTGTTAHAKGTAVVNQGDPDDFPLNAVSGGGGSGGVLRPWVLPNPAPGAATKPVEVVRPAPGAPPSSSKVTRRADLRLGELVRALLLHILAWR